MPNVDAVVQPTASLPHVLVARNESFKSERSDKRVSFNNDVGVKHIPRGLRNQKQRIVSGVEDEWADCAQVHREQPCVSSEEFQRQADDLLKVLEQVECRISRDSQKNRKPHHTRSLERPLKKNNSFGAKRNNKNNFSSTFINNIKNNKLQDNSLDRKNSKRSKLPSLHLTTNLLKGKAKTDINRSESLHPLPNGDILVNGTDLGQRPLASHQSCDQLYDTDRENHTSYLLAGHKSVPDLSRAVDSNHIEAKTYSSSQLNQDTQKGLYSSSELLLDSKHCRPPLKRKNNNKTYSSFKSAENLVETHPVDHSQLPSYKSAGHLPDIVHASSSDLSDLNMAQTSPYKSKVGNIINRLNSEAKGQNRGDRDPSPTRGIKEPDNLLSHNNNQPFSYTGGILSSVQAVRRLSPPRNTDSAYSQVNKYNKWSSAKSQREMERNRINEDTEREYSAKIIIQGSRPSQLYEDDDHAYETYHVNSNKTGHYYEGHSPHTMKDIDIIASDDMLNNYKSLSNSNINMSSVAVQTETLSRAPNRSRQGTRTHSSPVRQNQVRSQRSFKNDLTSASLVRQVNHGFGRMDRSPSPPPRSSASRKAPRSVVPLLSDTSDSEADFRRSSDPMAKIRDQVMVNERMYGEDHEGIGSDGTGRRKKKFPPYGPNDMRPLTIDEIDSLSFGVDRSGRSALLLSQGKSSNKTVSTNYIKHHSEMSSEHIKSGVPKDGIQPQKPPREKNLPPWERSSPPRHLSTLERNKKNNLEKERIDLEMKDYKIKFREKKKKKPKIQFYYEPKEENTNDDRLSRFTEYKGTSSDERSSPNYDRDGRKQRNRPLSADDPRGKRESSETRFGSKENLRQAKPSQSPSRDLRDQSKDTKTSKASKISKFTKESFKERFMSKASKESKGSRDTKVTRSRSAPRSRSSVDRESGDERRKSGSHLDDSHFRSSRKDDAIQSAHKDHYDYDYENQREITETRQEDSKMRRQSYENRLEDYASHRDDYESYEVRGSPDGRPGRSLSDKYKNAGAYDSSLNDTHYLDDPLEFQHAEEEEHEERLQRQRKKFLSSFIGEGRAKSSTLTRTVSHSPPPSRYSTFNRPSGKSAPPAVSSAATKRDTVVTKKESLQETFSHEDHPILDEPDSKSTRSKEQTLPKKKKKRQRLWPWTFLGLRGAKRRNRGVEGSRGPPSTSGVRASSRASSRCSSRTSQQHPRRPSVRATKIRRDSFEGRRRITTDRGLEEKDLRSGVISRGDFKSRHELQDTPSGRDFNGIQKTRVGRKSSGESTASSNLPQDTKKTARPPSFKQRYFGDTDIESRNGIGAGDYRSLPIRSSRAAAKRQAMANRKVNNRTRRLSPAAAGSAGSSLQSSESEDSHQGSYASKASHISTGSNRSVTVHPKTVADIPVRRSGSNTEDSPSDQGISRQSKKVSRSFSMLAPWKPKHYKERLDVEYDNREGQEAPREPSKGKSALPPKPPRRQAEPTADSKVSRSQSVYKDSRLAGWLKRRKNKESKGI